MSVNSNFLTFFLIFKKGQGRGVYILHETKSLKEKKYPPRNGYCRQLHTQENSVLRLIWTLSTIFPAVSFNLCWGSFSLAILFWPLRGIYNSFLESFRPWHMDQINFTLLFRLSLLFLLMVKYDAFWLHYFLK